MTRWSRLQSWPESTPSLVKIGASVLCLFLAAGFAGCDKSRPKEETTTEAPNAAGSSNQEFSQRAQTDDGPPRAISATAGTETSLVRPSGFYSLAFADPEDAQLCEHFLVAMQDPFVAAPIDPEKAYGPGSIADYLHEPGLLFMGSPSTIEPWQRIVLKQLSGDAFMGFREADLNRDAVPDRVYRQRSFVGTRSPNKELLFHLLYFRLGVAGESPVAMETDRKQVDPSWGNTGYTKLDLPSTAATGRPFKFQSFGSFFNYSMFLDDGATYFMASSPVFPDASATALFLLDFEGSQPYVACHLTSNFRVPDKYQLHPEHAFSPTPPQKD